MTHDTFSSRFATVVKNDVTMMTARSVDHIIPPPSERSETYPVGSEV
jgi:hypothetical protein